MSPIVGHTVANLYFPLLTDRLPAQLTCSCGVTLEAEADRMLPDPWTPVTEAWLAHRRSNGQVASTSPEHGYRTGGVPLSVYQTPAGRASAQRGRVAARKAS